MMATEDSSSNLQELETEDENDINILLLGETGVGKSTFINSFGYYIRFNSFDEATYSDEVQLLIPTVFTVINEHHKKISIKDRSDSNEEQKIGAAGTQNVKTYIFPIDGGKTRLRLIDSPGVGDPRGIKRDDYNCENILAYLSKLNELHAICFLFKPTNTRLTVLFEYCINQVLSRLEKSASENIIFIFTNTRAQFYTPGDTMPCLEDLINNVKNKSAYYIEIPLNRNIFCMDNEAFNYMLAKKRGIKFTEQVENQVKQSWKYSSKACWDLIYYILGKESHDPLKPHQLLNTISINDARKTIVQLSQPLVDISQLISDNILVLKRHTSKLTNTNKSLNELKAELYVPFIKLEVTQLSKPVTVCTSKKCADMVKVGEVHKWHYRQRCHDPCYLNNVPKEIVGDLNLKNCTAMRGTRECRVCECDFSVHMHVYYLTKTVEDRAVDHNVQADINKKEEALRECERLIGEMNRRKAELEQERKVITQSMVKFSHFLQYNAITPFNDSYKSYIEYLIEREKGLGEDSSFKIIEDLEKLIKQYNEMKETFAQSLKNKHVLQVTTTDVHNISTKLYQLKHTGSKIRELLTKQKRSRNAEYHTSCEVIPYTESVIRTSHPKNKAVKNRKKKDVKNDNENRVYNLEQYFDQSSSNDGVSTCSSTNRSTTVERKEKVEEKNRGGTDQGVRSGLWGIIKQGISRLWSTSQADEETKSGTVGSREEKRTE